MSNDIHPKGSPSAQVWVVIEQPYDQDKAKSYCFSGSYGFVFDKMMHDAGIHDYYVIPRRPELDNRSCFTIIENELNHYKPPIIIPLEESGKYLCDELRPKRGKKSPSEADCEIEKYAGSLLQSPLLQYPHYVIPTYAPDTIVKDWSLRDIVVSLDLGKCRSELDYFQKNGKLQPLPERTLKYEINDFDELMSYLDRFENASILSNDIENTYPNKKSAFYPHPGEIITIGLADAIDFGISFDLFGYGIKQTVQLFRKLNQLFKKVKQLGQNFFNHDLFRYEALGFEIPLHNIEDTMIRQHILWPELPKSLQFMARQYTRQPFWKDEGHHWNLKNMKLLRHYNCLDVCGTLEIYLEQDKEFAERPYLR